MTLVETDMIEKIISAKTLQKEHPDDLLEAKKKVTEIKKEESIKNKRIKYML